MLTTSIKTKKINTLILAKSKEEAQTHTTMNNNNKKNKITEIKNVGQ